MSTKKQQNKESARSAVTVAFTTNGWDEYEHWKTADSDIFDKIDALIKECLRTPFKGTGKPESLSGDLSGFWSRRITREHRLVYLYEGGVLTIIGCRFHYD